MKRNGIKIVFHLIFLSVLLPSCLIFLIVHNKKEKFILKLSEELSITSEINQLVSFGHKLEIIKIFKINFLSILASQQSFWSILSEESFQLWRVHSLNKTLRNGWEIFWIEKEEEDLVSILNLLLLVMLLKMSQQLVQSQISM